VGEAVAKNPPLAKEVVGAFETGCENARGKFWKKFAERKAAKKTMPLVKICGITREEDGMLAAELGADMLGFVFSTTKRLTTEEFVRSFAAKIRSDLSSPHSANGVEGSPFLVGVITDPESPEGKTAIKLAREGVLDAVQFHGIEPTKCLELADDKVTELVEGTNKIGIPYYCAARVGAPEDFDFVATLRSCGEPRILLDAKVEGIPGGTGKTIPESLLLEKAGDLPLWLAGGINPENVGEIVAKFRPELIDVSSGVEDAPGIKNAEKMRKLFEILQK
jgi:indole-3-glycerol phosphate synthase/phosphoribosylanthranilate isomerase